MKIPFRWIWPIAGLLALVGALHAGSIELRGVFRQGESILFSLHDNQSGESAWQAVGDTFRGWRLVAYEPAAQVLVVARGDQSERIRLATATITELKPGEPWPRAIAKAELARIAASAANLTGNIMPQAEAIRLGLAGPDRPLSELSEAEYDRLLQSLRQNQQLPHAAKSLGVPVGYKPFGREILPPEMSANLTDDDIAEANAQFAAALDYGLVPLMRRLEAEQRAQRPVPRAESAAAPAPR